VEQQTDTSPWERLARGLLDLVYPPRCLVCDEPDSDALCAECARAIRSAGSAAPLVEPVLDGVVAVGRHEGVLREAVHGLKYGRRRALAAPLGALLAQRLEEALADGRPEVVAPVPIHWRRRLWRGFNQAELLADALARTLGMRVEPTVVARVRHTPSQVSLTGEARRRNLAGAFAVPKAEVVRDRRVLLVDDVCTTCTTLAECARVLRHAGARSVHGLVLSC
jgi:ComF family protein